MSGPARAMGVAKRPQWYREPSREDLARMCEVSFLQRGQPVKSPPRSHSSLCREVILAIERQINGGKQLSK